MFFRVKFPERCDGNSGGCEKMILIMKNEGNKNFFKISFFFLSQKWTLLLYIKVKIKYVQEKIFCIHINSFPKRVKIFFHVSKYIFRLIKNI